MESPLVSTAVKAPDEEDKICLSGDISCGVRARKAPIHHGACSF